MNESIVPPPMQKAVSVQGEWQCCEQLAGNPGCNCTPELFCLKIYIAIWIRRKLLHTKLFLVSFVCFH